jgi:hypothetical protein
MVADVGLALSVATAGLWSGLLLTITTRWWPSSGSGTNGAVRPSC